MKIIKEWKHSIEHPILICESSHLTFLTAYSTFADEIIESSGLISVKESSSTGTRAWQQFSLPLFTEALLSLGGDHRRVWIEDEFRIEEKQGEKERTLWLCSMPEKSASLEESWPPPWLLRSSYLSRYNFQTEKRTGLVENNFTC